MKWSVVGIARHWPAFPSTEPEVLKSRADSDGSFAQFYAKASEHYGFYTIRNASCREDGSVHV